MATATGMGVGMASLAPSLSEMGAGAVGPDSIYEDILLLYFLSYSLSLSLLSISECSHPIYSSIQPRINIFTFLLFYFYFYSVFRSHSEIKESCRISNVKPIYS